MFVTPLSGDLCRRRFLEDITVSTASGPSLLRGGGLSFAGVSSAFAAHLLSYGILIISLLLCFIQPLVGAQCLPHYAACLSSRLCFK